MSILDCLSTSEAVLLEINELIVKLIWEKDDGFMLWLKEEKSIGDLKKYRIERIVWIA